MLHDHATIYGDLECRDVHVCVSLGGGERPHVLY